MVLNQIYFGYRQKSKVNFSYPAPSLPLDEAMVEPEGKEG